MNKKVAKITNLYNKKLKNDYLICLENKFNPEYMTTFIIDRLSYARDYYILNYCEEYNQKIVDISLALSEYEEYQKLYQNCLTQLATKTTVNTVSVKAKLAEDHRKLFWSMIAEKSKEWNI